MAVPKVWTRSETYSLRNSSAMLPPSLVIRCSRQQVAGELPGEELVVGQVLVERADDPVAPRPDVAVAVGLVAEGVGVAGHVQPVHRQALAEVRRGQQPVGRMLIRLRRRVGEEDV